MVFGFVSMALKLSQEDFLIKSMRLHGSRYDYSQSIYINSRSKIKIICEEHGAFFQKAALHLNGAGCRMCSRKRETLPDKRKSQDLFISQSKKIHGDKYDYSLCSYRTSSEKVKIICRIHGIFEQVANSHLQGSGCGYCSGNKSNLDLFIEKANYIHNFFYDYSYTNYEHHRSRVKIRCPIHGIFEQRPYLHLRGRGCKKCFVDRSLKDVDSLIREFREVHGNFYDYSCISSETYKSSIIKLEISCPIHGKFYQLSSNHRKGQGCPTCGVLISKLTTDEFIEKSRLIHGDLYDYSPSQYLGSDIQIDIICKKHGIFKTLPRTHLSGHRCPNCSETSGESQIRNILASKQITFKAQYTFDNCVDKIPLRFDFFIPELNLCIEYDGIQHYQPVKYFGGIKKFEDTVRKDSIKNRFCKDNGIKLLRIRYDEDIYNILKQNNLC